MKETMKQDWISLTPVQKWLLLLIVGFLNSLVLMHETTFILTAQVILVGMFLTFFGAYICCAKKKVGDRVALILGIAITFGQNIGMFVA